MLTERPPTQNVSPTPVSLGLNVLLEKTNISALLQEQTIAEFNSKHLQTLMWELVPESPMVVSKSIQESAQQQVEVDYPESDYQWLVEVLETLTDIASRNANNNFVALTEADYKQLDAVLKELIYIVGDNEKHPLSPLMDFIGILVSKYENEHFPKLTDLFPELTENTTPNDTRDEERKRDSITEVSEKPINNAAANAFFSIGSLFSMGSKVDEAISAYDQTIHLNPEYTYAYYNRGRAKVVLGQYESGIADFDKTLQLTPDFNHAYLMRGGAKASLGCYESAAEDINESLRLKPDDSDVYFIRGCVKVGLKQYEAAIEDFDKHIQLMPDEARSSHTYFIRGCVKDALERYEAAIEDFGKSIQLMPDIANAYFMRGHVKNVLERYEAAIEDFDKGLQLKPDDAYAYFMRGSTMLELGRHQSALTGCGEAIRRNPDLAETYRTRGEAHRLLSKTQEAKADYQKALELAEQTDNQDLKTEIEQLLKELDNTE